ncbi:MAG: enoyl-CoA hydratase/isomerase family protein [Deltaproteobacteria bacterium]|nr:enoyl-CoA hydratase/isomerase family protein [Deltaproteobacteria bacterium]MBW2360105.1 enoyl-CoA hydratase/isomerase family protein [Deltaproteobacteria bacterium]
MESIRQEMRGAVALVTLARPDALNALDTATLTGIQNACSEVASDTKVRALVLTGEGRAFAAGADIAEMSGKDVLFAERFSRRGHAACAALEELPIPTIAAVNGVALGGGCELALACDWIYASDKARFGQPEVKLGLIPGFGGTSRLVRRVGVAWAKELVLTGEPVDAETAQRIGLVNRVFPADGLLDEALAAAEAIAARGPLAVSVAKRVMQEGQGADVRVAHALEQVAFATVFGSQDRIEGIGAFLEKRDAKFEGR